MTRTKKKHMRLPNGFGQITCLKGNHRKPYRVMITIGFNEQGRPIAKLLKPKSYFETYNDAYMALMTYHQDPYNLEENISLGEVYDRWSEEHFKRVSEARIRAIKQAYKYLSELSLLPIREIKPVMIKDLLNDLPKSTIPLTKSVLNMIFDYAMEYELVSKNAARIAKVDEHYRPTGHQTFTDAEIKILWENINDEVVRWLLIQCYTGLRPGELIDLKVENIFLNEGYMIGGLKTEAGINRRIPIHVAIQDLMAKQLEISAKYGSKYLLVSENGQEIKYQPYRLALKNLCSKYHLNDHQAHDPRKFFVTEAKKYQLDEYAIKLIVGHRIDDLTERVYTERPVEWLISEVNKIPTLFVHA